MHERDNTTSVRFNFQLEPGFDVMEAHAALTPVARTHGFRDHGAGTWLDTGIRDVGGEMPTGNVCAMDADLRKTLRARYLGYVIVGGDSEADASHDPP